jgi:hypothetical protein
MTMPNLVEKEWLEFARVMGLDDYEELLRAKMYFFAGAIKLYNLVVVKGSDQNIPLDDQIKHLDTIWQELDDFKRQYAA